MGSTKNHIHTPDQIALARLFKALGHPARIAIIDNLLEKENLNCKELGKYIQLAQSTISVHIKELHDVGVLSVRVIANNAYYEVYKPVLEQVTSYLDQVYQHLKVAVSNQLTLYCKPFYDISLQRLVNTT